MNKINPNFGYWLDKQESDESLICSIPHDACYFFAQPFVEQDGKITLLSNPNIKNGKNINISFNNNIFTLDISIPANSHFYLLASEFINLQNNENNVEITIGDVQSYINVIPIGGLIRFPITPFSNIGYRGLECKSKEAINLKLQFPLRLNSVWGGLYYKEIK